MRLFYKEKMGDKRVIHILGLKISYKKKRNGVTEYKKRLSKEEWSNLYNVKQVKSMVFDLTNKHYTVQTNEIFNVIPKGAKTLEIGSGTGQSSLVLAQKGCEVTLLDFSQDCLELSRETANELNLKINTVCIDATLDLPFQHQEFDYIFHSGLLEHFTKEERIKMLKHWSKYCKYMISLVPNATCLAYRVGKKIMEQNGTWNYGVENPLYTQIDDFQQAGYNVLKEYTIGVEHSLNFLNKQHPLRKELENSIKNNEILSDFHQGYLLVTIGKTMQL